MNMLFFVHLKQKEFFTDWKKNDWSFFSTDTEPQKWAQFAFVVTFLPHIVILIADLFDEKICNHVRTIVLCMQTILIASVMMLKLATLWPSLNNSHTLLASLVVIFLNHVGHVDLAIKSVCLASFAVTVGIVACSCDTINFPPINHYSRLHPLLEFWGHCALQYCFVTKIFVLVMSTSTESQYVELVVLHILSSFYLFVDHSDDKVSKFQDIVRLS